MFAKKHSNTMVYYNKKIGRGHQTINFQKRVYKKYVGDDQHTYIFANHFKLKKDVITFFKTHREVR